MWIKHLAQPHSIPNFSRAMLIWLTTAVLALQVSKWADWPLWVLATQWVSMLVVIYTHLAVMRRPRQLWLNIYALVAFALALATSTGSWVEGLYMFLGVALSIKMLSLKRWLDIGVFVFIYVFLLASALVIEQSIAQLSVVLAAFTCLFLFCLSLEMPSSAWPQVSKKMMRLALQTLPIFVLLFLFMPRLNALWQTIPANAAKTGLSESLSPGNISELVDSDELVFRAKFSGSQPTPQQRYWRALVHEDFDGNAWLVSDERKRLSRMINRGFLNPFQQRGTALETYSLLTEPSAKSWLPVLEHSRVQDDSVFATDDLRLFSRMLQNQTRQFELDRYRPDWRTEMSIDEKSTNLQLPDEGGEQIRRWAREQRQTYTDDDEFVQFMLSFFSREAYFYTLKPPILPGDWLDNFFFETRSGFCGHYASAMAVALRSVGIPTRVVSGYLGGEYNVEAKYLAVYQFDAHAWVEYWSPGVGWRRVDPTAAVAPERVLSSLAGSVSDPEQFLASSWFSRHLLNDWPALQFVAQQLAAMDYYWSVWVLGYDTESQLSLLKSVIEDADESTLRHVLIALLIIACVVIAVWVMRNPRIQQPLPIRYWLDVERALAAKGYFREQNETPKDLLNRESNLLALSKLNAFVNYWYNSQYAKSDAVESDNKLKHLKLAAIKEIRQSLIKV